MLNTQLVTLLKSFSTAELAQLRLFVQSPFFTTLNDMPLLLDFITNLIEQEKQKTPVDTENETTKQKLQPQEAEHQAAEQRSPEREDQAALLGRPVVEDRRLGEQTGHAPQQRSGDDRQPRAGQGRGGERGRSGD